MSEENDVRLRMLEERDLEYLMKWDNDPRVTHYIGKRFADAGEGNRWVTQMISDPRSIVLIIEVGDGEPVGSIQLLDINWRKKTAELRIFIGEPHLWNRGIGTQALGLLINWAVERWHFNQLYLRVDADNLRARRVYEKCGFHTEGIIRAGKHPALSGKLVLMTLDLQESRERLA